MNPAGTPPVVVKRSQPLRIAEASAIAPGPGPNTVGPIFRGLVPHVLKVLRREGVEPGMSVGHYEGLADGSLVVHVGFEIDPGVVMADIYGVSSVELPVVTVASLMHHGSLDTLLESFEQLAHWIHDSGHSMSGLSRELYLQSNDDDPARNVTELQTVLAT